MRRSLVPALLAALCIACAPISWRKRSAEVRDPPPLPSRAVQARPSGSSPTSRELPTPELPPPGATTLPQPGIRPLPGTTEVSARARLSQAQALVDQTRVLLPGWTEADTSAQFAHEALARNDWGRAAAFAQEASARSDAALSNHYATLAERELVRAHEFIGLDDAQLVQLRAAEETLVAGNGRLAYGRLRSLNSQLGKRLRTYTVKGGDSLWAISGRPEIYGNPWLWPLIWQANLSALPNPDHLLKGQVLRLRPHPTLEEAAGAIREARHEAGVIPRIGEVREVKSP
ncbi:MAG: LysM peptidoglycan-binding domain-containing protein [Panacagrimonas sp.]